MCDVVWKLGDFDPARRNRNTQEEIRAHTLFRSCLLEPPSSISKTMRNADQLDPLFAGSCTNSCTNAPEQWLFARQ